MTNTISKNRQTRETAITLQLTIDGRATANIATGLKFFDHMLEQLAFHAGWDLSIQAEGDVDVDDHHLIEDVAIVLGDALNDIRQSRSGLARYGQRLLPMDASLILCAVDLDGRGHCVCDLPFTRETVGQLATEMWPHFFKTLSSRGQFSLHIKTMYFDNNHHLIEGAFKSLARALREALSINGQGISSTKGLL